MKKFLVATIFITATTAAFGAASLRTTKVGSGATATPITAPGRARAGTLRSQPTKTISSTSVTPAPQKTVATPAAQTSTNARLSLLKAPGNLSIKDIKDTGAVNQQFANIDSRIDNIEENIGDMVSAQTYTRSEIDEMLRAITPTVDSDGYINIPTAGGEPLRQSPYWFWFHTEMPPISYRDVYHFSGVYDEERINAWVNEICNNSASDDRINCCLEDPEGYGGHNYSGNIHSFGVWQFFPGYLVQDEFTITRNGRQFLRRMVATAVENEPLTYLHDEICGTRPAEDCWVEEVHTHYPCVNQTGTRTNAYVYSAIQEPEPDPEPELPYWLVYFHNGEIDSLTNYETHANPTNATIQDWVSDICAATPASDAANMLGCCSSQCTLSDPNTQCFNVERMFHGYEVTSSKIIARNNQLLLEQTVQTYENDSLNYVRTQLCGNRPSTECWVDTASAGYSNTCDSNITLHAYIVYSIFEYYLYNVGEEPTIDGLGRKITIRTNAPDNMLKLYSDYWCSPRDEFWCKTFIEDIPNSTDRLFIIRIRHHGVKCSTDHMSTVGTYMQCATNENNTTESYTLDYVNSKICGAAAGTDTCYVTHITDAFGGRPENFENNQEPITRYDVSLFKSMVEEEKPPLRLEK